MRTFVYAIAVLGWVTACNGSSGVSDGGVPPGAEEDGGDSGQDGGGDSGGSIPLDSGLLIGETTGVETNAFARAACAKAIECGDSRLGAVSEQECAVYYSLPCWGYQNVEEQDGLEACLDSIARRSCSNSNLFGVECLNAFTRARARELGTTVQTMKGGECGAGVQCTDGMYCSSLGESCGACMGGAKVGQPCDNHSCGFGRCDHATNLCVEEKADGEACTSSDECNGLGCTDGVCTRFAEESCTNNDDCASQRCRDGECIEGEAPGAACSDNSDCDAGGACDARVCKLVARCTFGEVGESCAPRGCRSDLLCMSNVCTARTEPSLPDGEACRSYTDCASGHCVFVAGVPPVCGPRQVNYTCDDDAQCESGACVDFRCAGATSCTP
jgi:hypothetical protein